LTDADLSIGTKRTPRQEVKSNSALDDRQHNAELRRRNLKKTQKKKLDMCENHLFRLNEMEKKKKNSCIYKHIKSATSAVQTLKSIMLIK